MLRISLGQGQGREPKLTGERDQYLQIQAQAKSVNLQVGGFFVFVGFWSMVVGLWLRRKEQYGAIIVERLSIQGLLNFKQQLPESRPQACSKIALCQHYCMLRLLASPNFNGCLSCESRSLCHAYIYWYTGTLHGSKLNIPEPLSLKL